MLYHTQNRTWTRYHYNKCVYTQPLRRKWTDTIGGPTDLPTDRRTTSKQYAKGEGGHKYRYCVVRAYQGNSHKHKWLDSFVEPVVNTTYKAPDMSDVKIRVLYKVVVLYMLKYRLLTNLTINGKRKFWFVLRVYTLPMIFNINIETM